MLSLTGAEMALALKYGKRIEIDVKMKNLNTLLHQCFVINLSKQLLLLCK